MQFAIDLLFIGERKIDLKQTSFSFYNLLTAINYQTIHHFSIYLCRIVTSSLIIIEESLNVLDF